MTRSPARPASSWRPTSPPRASTGGIPTPAFSSSLAYYDGLRRDRLPAALIQGLRDNFGAHTYRRVDADGVFHTDWAGDNKEHPACPSRDRGAPWRGPTAALPTATGLAARLAPGVSRGRGRAGPPAGRRHR